MRIFRGKGRKLFLRTGSEPKGFQWGVIAIFTIVVGAFVVAPIIPSFWGSGVYTFGSYKGIPIEFYSGSDMEREVSSLSRDIPSQAEGVHRRFYYQQIWYTAFMRQAMRLAVEARLKDSGLLISEEKSNELVKNYKGFVNGQGNFDLTLYNRYSNEQKIRIRKELEKLFLWKRYEDDITNNPISPTFLAWLEDMGRMSLSVSWVKFTKEDIPSVELKRFIEEKGNLLLVVSADLIAFAEKKEAEKMLVSLKAGEMTQEEIDRNQKENFNTALYYELADLVREENQDNLLEELQVGKGFSSLYKLKDGRFGFFFMKKGLSVPDLSQTTIRDKIILYIKMNQGDFYREVLERVAEENYHSRVKEIAPVTLNPGGSTLYSSELGGLSSFSEYNDFYKTVFSLRLGEWSRPFSMGDDVYVFQVIKRHDNSSLDFTQVKEALILEKVQNLQDDLLNKRDFKDNFFEVYYKSGIGNAVNF